MNSLRTYFSITLIIRYDTVMKRIAIIGFGRFGQLLSGLARDEFDVVVIEQDKKRRGLAKSQGFKVVPMDMVGKAEIIFLAVPISALEKVIQEISPLVGKDQVVVDVCSVKVFPAALMKKYLPKAQTLATHPLFGPDSAKGGLKGLKTAFCRLSIDDANLKLLRDFWESKGAEVVLTTPGEHDRDMVYSLAFTHTIARVIDGMNIPNIKLTTKNYEALKRVAELSMKDTDQLYYDMLYFNPYLETMAEQLIAANKDVMDTVAAVSKAQQETRGKKDE